MKNSDSAMARRKRNPSLTGLTVEENRLLSALVRHPEETDRRLSEISGLDLKNTTYLRIRMQKLGIFRYLRIPAFGRLGAGVFWACILDKGSDGKGQGSSNEIKRALKALPGVFWAVSDGSETLVLGICKNREEVMAGIARSERTDGLNAKETVVLPIEALEKGSFFDFARVLENPAGVSAAEPGGPPIGTAGSFRPLLEFEKEALQALVDFPDEGPTALARRLGISVKMFQDRTEEIERERLYRTVVVPDIRFLGRDTLAVWMAGAVCREEPVGAEVQDDPADTEAAPLRMDPGASGEQEREPAAVRPVPLDTCAASEGRAGPPGELPTGNRDGPPEEAPRPVVEMMPWQYSPMITHGKPRHEAPESRESGRYGAKRGMEALPKDIARTLIGRPSREAVERARQELEHRRLWDIDLDRILQDAGVIPVKRWGPGDISPAPARTGQAGGSGPTKPVDDGRVPAGGTGEGGNGAAGGQGAGRGVLEEGEKGAAPTCGDVPQASLMERSRAGDAKCAVVIPVKRKRGRPPKNRIGPAGTVAVAVEKGRPARGAAGKAQRGTQVPKRKRGRPRKKHAKGNLAMAMERFSVRVVEKGQDSGRGPVEPETDLEAVPVFLDATDSGRRIMVGLFRDEEAARQADLQVRRGIGKGSGLRLMRMTKLEIVKELSFGSVVRELLAEY